MTAPDLTRAFRAMACDVTVRVLDPGPGAESAMEQVEALFRRIESTCTRFDPTSDLMQANAAGDNWTRVDPECWAALALAHEAHVRTRGLFDPRVLTALQGMGYATSWEGRDATTSRADGPPSSHSEESRPSTAWSPDFDADGSSVRIGPVPVDLGGIGKGYAVRRGIELLRGRGPSVGRAALVEAGGDLATFGAGPGEGGTWRAAVEDPLGRDEPLAVIDATDAATATSSVRQRSWEVDGVKVHHLIDPATGRPAESGVRAVTVVGHDPAWAEVWTKVGFLQGASRIADFMEAAGLAALWVTDDGALRTSRAMRPRLLWAAREVL